MRCALLVLLVSLLAVLDGCGCRKKTEEELLESRIDATPVHLWLAAKIAVGGQNEDPGDDDVKAARKVIHALIDAARKRDAKGALVVMPEDAAHMALALWKLRGLGKAAFDEHASDVPRPVISSLLSEGKLDPIVDAPTEHGVFLVALTAAKIHPDLAVPVPPELLLYEARWTDPDKTSIATFGPVARAFKAYVFGTSELCALAQREADKLPEGEVFTADAIAHDLTLLSGVKTEPKASHQQFASAAVVTLASGATAICYLQRDEPEKATKPIRRVVAAAETAGLDGEGVEFLRGYVECIDGDAEVGKKKLEAFLRSTRIRDRERDAARLLLARCGKNGMMAKTLDKLTLAGVVGLLALDLLEQSGAIDALLRTPLARSIGGLVTGVGGSVDKAKSAVPSYADAKKGVKGWFGK